MLGSHVMTHLAQQVGCCITDLTVKEDPQTHETGMREGVQP